MTTEQIAINDRALRSGAARLEEAGFQGNAHAFVENLILAVLDEGFRPLPKPVPARGPGASRAAIDNARDVVAKGVAAAKERRMTATVTTKEP